MTAVLLMLSDEAVYDGACLLRKYRFTHDLKTNSLYLLGNRDVGNEFMAFDVSLIVMI